MVEPAFSMVARNRRIMLLGALAIIPISYFALRKPFPSDRTPEGAYLRIAEAIVRDHPTGIFPYLETDAQWASYTIRDARRDSLAKLAPFPTEERARLEAAYRDEGTAPDGSDLFALLAKKRGWLDRLRKDLSGVVGTEIVGERATVVTAMGTRVAFRRRDNGIWGLTMFTAELIAERDRAVRDLEVVTHASADYAKKP